MVDEAETSITLTLHYDESRNVITFDYQEFDATFEYQYICADPTSGVKVSRSREVVDPDDNSPNALTGAFPYETDTYYFAGWFADPECTKPINASTIVSEKYAVTLDEKTNLLVPTKTDIEYSPEGSDEVYTGKKYLKATYYALFLPRSAELTVKVDGLAGDSFILNFTGQEGTFAEGKTFTVAVVDGVEMTVTDVPIGNYKVTINENWSWRYPALNDTQNTVEVKVSAGGSLSLTLTPDESKWLTEDAYGTFGSN